jgi:hypothetical protein
METCDATLREHRQTRLSARPTDCDLGYTRAAEVCECENEVDNLLPPKPTNLSKSFIISNLLEELFAPKPRSPLESELPKANAKTRKSFRISKSQFAKSQSPLRISFRISIASAPKPSSQTRKFFGITECLWGNRTGSRLVLWATRTRWWGQGPNIQNAVWSPLLRSLFGLGAVLPRIDFRVVRG